MVGTAYHLRNFYDVKDNDVFWATSDIGWVVGHSYIVYAPLVEGVTSVFREGAPDFPHPGIILGMRGEVWRQRDVHGADGGAHVYEVRRRACARSMTSPRCG
jgi:hypothetical protein